jgi:aminotransferase
MANIAGLDAGNDVDFCRTLVEEIGVAAVPGSSFFSEPGLGQTWVRFCFAKKPETLDAAAERLARLLR